MCAAIACGAKENDRPRGVRASADASGIEVSWQAVSGARAYRVQLADLDTREQRGDPVVVRATSAHLEGAFARSLGVWVDALLPDRTARGVGFVSAGASGGTGASWQMFGPQDFRAGAVRASFQQLAPGEHLGVLLLNSGGRDPAIAQVDATGVAAAPAPSEPPAGHTGLRMADQRAPALHAPQEEIVETAAPSERVVLADHTSFCVVPGMDFSRHVRKPATRLLSTAHADFFADDDDAAHYDAALMARLGGALEERVLPSSNAAFGPPTDVDGNGKLLVLLTHELGAHLNGGWLIGYFGNGDLLRGRDESRDCSGTGSNHAEIIYLNDVANGAANGYSVEDLAAVTYPATIAHELQHLINLGRRCVERACDGPEATWINEALSKVAEDLAGYGWNAPRGRAEGAFYLSRPAYEGRSLTKWEGDPIGNYQGAHSFLRFFADRLGDRLPGEVNRDAGGVPALEDALGRPLPRAMAEWASALLLSNEAGAAYNFSGAAWLPLHQRLRHLDYRRPGEQVSMRTDGIAAFVSGAGQGGAAEVTVRSGEDVPPHVVVVRIQGDLPRD
jgi:hypothetical protein